MAHPNLFDYATKELSQDAMICWLIAWSAYDGDAELAWLGRRLVTALLSHKRGGRMRGGVVVQNLEIMQQEKNIDVLVRINWAGFGADSFWLKLWESQHDLRVGEQIEIRAEPESPIYWRGRVTDVAGQNVSIGETELRSSRR